MWAPMLPLMVDVENAFMQPWVLGYRHSEFGPYFQYIDIDLARCRTITGQ